MDFEACAERSKVCARIYADVIVSLVSRQKRLQLGATTHVLNVFGLLDLDLPLQETDSQSFWLQHDQMGPLAKK